MVVVSPSWQLLDSRSISGKGILIPSISSSEKIRFLKLFCDVIRPPRNLYVNTNYNPSKSRYATLVFEQNGYVVTEYALEYPKQTFLFEADYSSLILSALTCAYDGVLDSFVNLGLSLGAQPIIKQNNLLEFKSTKNLFDKIKVVCYADTAIKLELWGLDVYYCLGEPPQQTPPQPPNRQPPPSVPPGTKLNRPGDLSPPYDGNNDGGDTVPYTEDEYNPEEPIGNNCERWVLTYQYTRKNSNVLSPIYTARVYAPFKGFQLRGVNDTQLFLECQGTWREGFNDPCTPLGFYLIRIESDGILKPKILTAIKV